MTDRHELEVLFVDNLPIADRIVGALARRHGLDKSNAEEFGSWARARIIENDYAMLAKFRGESSLSTYLTVCLAMLFREYRVAEWGRWRPSVAARRQGAVAIRLETLVRRDSLPLAQAGEILRTSGETKLTDRELAGVLSKLPMRGPLRPVQTGEPSFEPIDGARADDFVVLEESAAEGHAAHRALEGVLDELPAEDRVIVRMHYLEELSVADIARGLSLPQKPLYRRLERALKTLRAGLERVGISSDSIRGLGSDPPW